MLPRAACHQLNFDPVPLIRALIRALSPHLCPHPVTCVLTAPIVHALILLSGCWPYHQVFAAATLVPQPLLLCLPLTHSHGHSLAPGLLMLSHVPSYPPSCALTLLPSLHALSYQFPCNPASHTHSSFSHHGLLYPLFCALTSHACSLCPPPSRITTLYRP